jgi:hypothetical protein
MHRPQHEQQSTQRGDAMPVPSDAVQLTLRDADRLRGETARLSRRFKHMSTEKRELEGHARAMQGSLDAFVRHSAEESHRLAAGVASVRGEMCGVDEQAQALEATVAGMQALCDAAAVQNAALRAKLGAARGETAEVAGRLAAFVAATKANAAALDALSRESREELQMLHTERRELTARHALR